MTSIRPGGRAMISGSREKTARNLSMRWSVIGLAQTPEARARLEAYELHRGDLHRLARVRVESLARRALRDGERSKADKMDLGVALEPPLHGEQHGIRRPFGRRPGGTVAQQLVHLIHEFGL